MPWRLLVSPPLDGPGNMALDEALMARARRGGDTVLRVYGWSVPTLSLGRNQTARGLYRTDLLMQRGIGVVRRPTGGRALLHDREITYSVTAPFSSSDALHASYARINSLLMSALASLGVPVASAPTGARALSPTGVPCFDRPSQGELTYQGRKLVGSAQWREDGALLQHGSILVDDDQSMIPSLMCEPAAAPPAPATLRDALGRAPVMDEVGAALLASVRALVDPRAMQIDVEPEVAYDAASLADRYRDDRWTWRR